MSHLFAALILCIIFPSAFHACIAMNIPLNSIHPLDLVNDTLISNISSPDKASNIFTQCSASVVSWLGFSPPIPNAFLDSCKAADELLQADIYKYGSRRLEFVNRRGSGTYGFEVMRTPLKYTAGTYLHSFHSLLYSPGSQKAERIFPGSPFACTITVVTMDVVPRRYVRPAPYRSRDVATFYDVRDALAEIWRFCLYGFPERKVGYAVTGMLCLPKHLMSCIGAADDRCCG